MTLLLGYEDDHDEVKNSTRLLETVVEFLRDDTPERADMGGLKETRRIL